MKVPFHQPWSEVRGASKKSTFRQRYAGAVADDDVIQQLDVHQGERLLDALGNELIRLARFRDARGMVVSHDDRGRIALQRQLDDLARMHARTVDRAAEQLLEVDEAVALVEIQAAKYFVLEVAELRGEKIAGRPRAGQGGSGAQRLRQLPPCDFGNGLNLGVANGSEPGLRAEARPIGGDQLAQ